jgi:hypothetical protein
VTAPRASSRHRPRRSRRLARLLSGVDLLVDFATLGEYGLGGRAAACGGPAPDATADLEVGLGGASGRLGPPRGMRLRSRPQPMRGELAIRDRKRVEVLVELARPAVAVDEGEPGKATRERPADERPGWYAAKWLLIP